MPAPRWSARADPSARDCEIVYGDLVEKLEENYIGLAQLKELKQDKEYEKRKITYKQKASNINGVECTKFLQEFLSYFEDGHLFTYESPRYSESEIQNIKGKIKADIIDIKSILRTLNFEKDIVEKNGLDGIIGKWTDGKSEFAIIKDEGYYKAYIINSTLETVEPGELKALFTSTNDAFEGTYYSYKYSKRYVEGDIYKEGNLLVFTGANYWGKIENNRGEIKTINHENIGLPVIQKIDNENTLLSIPSFMADPEKFNQPNH